MNIAQLVMEYRQILHNMGHPQPPTLMRTDNNTAHGLVTGTMKQKRSKETKTQTENNRRKKQKYKS